MSDHDPRLLSADALSFSINGISMDLSRLSKCQRSADTSLKVRLVS
jgi:hypothetical protein